MPLSRVIDSFDIATTQFDVAIIDEASQSDVRGLITFALAKEVVVVGDHEQVSPYAVGLQIEKIQSLINEILVDIPNKQLYDGKTSVYDLARQSFGGTIRLLEHFRCVPDIIQFSNHLCYNGEIRALREASSSFVKPPLICHHVKHGKKVDNINEQEALEIVSLISAICKFPEYDKCTLGVICMVGTDQAVYIDSLLRRKLTVSEFQKRRILCGNASQFQGDERDIIFISMVDSSKGRPLHLRQRDEVRKVFNVAASRARDQLWLIHSLNPNEDLKTGDLRLRLISHVQNPGGLRDTETENEKKKFNTDFEKEVYDALTEKGFHITPQCPVGEYVIDLVVEGRKGNRIAIQCDGDRLQQDEHIFEAMHRQMTLGRLGWQFIRIRGSEWFFNSENALKKILKKLKKFEIHPGEPKNKNELELIRTEELEAANELKEKVLRRAQIIRNRWRNIPRPKDLAKMEDEENDKAKNQVDEDMDEDAIEEARLAAQLADDEEDSDEYDDEEDGEEDDEEYEEEYEEEEGLAEEDEDEKNQGVR